ncbi:hypothetical protein AB0K11_04180 [Mycobacterium sp. NPDC050551]|uniref:hypothetical protein n=1 Tax=Mycobacterium sp. NPDC050551 TaxID=3155407 RepID=UPI00342F19A3
MVVDRSSAFSELQGAIDATQRAVMHLDGPNLRTACHRMHDAAAVGMPAHLPAPDRDVNAELAASAEDAHTAAHMCLAVAEKSPNTDDAEFISHLDLADEHVKAAVAGVNRLMVGQTWRMARVERSQPR